jgi:nucleoside-diphosphate-sugar epimerase
MTKVLITGGAGFIGGFLARRLVDQGHAVTLVDNFARGRADAFLDNLMADPGVRLQRRDLALPGALDDLGDNHSHVFHLAALLGVENVLRRPYATLRDNATLLMAALDLAARQRQLQRFVFASTSEVYAGSLEHLALPFPTPEQVPLALTALDQPRTSYMLSKIHGEALVRHAGLPFTIIRPHNVYGPRMGLSHVVPQLLEKAYHAAPGAALEVFSVEHRRTFCFIDDAIDMIGQAAFSERCAGEVLNVGNQTPEVTMGELARAICRTVGRDLDIAAQPATPGSPARRCPDMSRMAELTGVRAQVGLEEGLQRTWDWYRREVFDSGGPSAR